MDRRQRATTASSQVRCRVLRDSRASGRRICSHITYTRRTQGQGSTQGQRRRRRHRTDSSRARAQRRCLLDQTRPDLSPARAFFLPPRRRRIETSPFPAVSPPRVDQHLGANTKLPQLARQKKEKQCRRLQHASRQALARGNGEPVLPKKTRGWQVERPAWGGRELLIRLRPQRPTTMACWPAARQTKLSPPAQHPVRVLSLHAALFARRDGQSDGQWGPSVTRGKHPVAWVLPRADDAPHQSRDRTKHQLPSISYTERMCRPPTCASSLFPLPHPRGTCVGRQQRHTSPQPAPSGGQ